MPSAATATFFVRLSRPSSTGVTVSYATADDKYPDPFLGTTNWKIVEQSVPAGGEHRVVDAIDGQAVEREAHAAQHQPLDLRIGRRADAANAK